MQVQVHWTLPLKKEVVKGVYTLMQCESANKQNHALKAGYQSIYHD